MLSHGRIVAHFNFNVFAILQDAADSDEDGDGQVCLNKIPLLCCTFWRAFFNLLSHVYATNVYICD